MHILHTNFNPHRRLEASVYFAPLAVLKRFRHQMPWKAVDLVIYWENTAALITSILGLSANEQHPAPHGTAHNSQIHERDSNLPNSKMARLITCWHLHPSRVEYVRLGSCSISTERSRLEQVVGRDGQLGLVTIPENSGSVVSNPNPNIYR